MSECPLCKNSRPKDRCTGSKFQCVACGLHLADEAEARKHWRRTQDKHGLYLDTRGRAFEAALGGLERREHWDEVLMHILAGEGE